MYKVGIIGTSKITHKHILAVSKFPNIKIQSILGTYSSALSEFSTRYLLEPHSTFEAFLENPPDIAIITTSSERHFQVLDAIIPYIPYIIVEKPLTTKLADAEKVLEYANKNGTYLFVVSQYRFDRDFQTLSKIIRETDGQRSIKIDVRKHRPKEYYRDGTSISKALVFSQLPHFLDLAIDFLGPELEVVTAQTMNTKRHSGFSDTLFAKFKSGPNCLELTICTCDKTNKPIYIHFSGNGKSFSSKDFIITKESEQSWVKNIFQKNFEVREPKEDLFHNMYRHFFHLILSEADIKMELNRAILVMTHIDGILQLTGEDIGLN